MADKAKALEAVRDEALERQILEQAQKAGELDLGPVPEGFTERIFGDPLKVVGSVVQGVYEGAGREITLEDREEPLKSYRLRRKDGSTIDVPASAQIVTFFEGVKTGEEVRIAKVGKGTTRKGQQVNQYRFWTRSL